ncbi:DUF262 domain-containing protein [Brevibacterium sp. BDJS002]|uniref:DUF262 domain-containing protein n=1 Tax=Brevibacterium sp. BDJS002 TaxID=3020906 RepID=UPI002307AE37|nr:DUF262 domain-containing protein [Brevibacterium sp. BDJS002]WCE40393.1 DUF262 domain-containing protein [Brevibacterium sp. BDJS002]
MRIRTALLDEITLLRFNRLRSVVNLDPPYQREGGIWSTDTRRTLIDSIINGLDIPKLYFEANSSHNLNADGLTYQYSVIDGKQRLEAVISFLDNELALDDKFIFFEDLSVSAAGMTLDELDQQYPLLARRFLEYQLPIVRVESDSDDLIEEMFQRLNASSSLNAAERRNSLSGPTKKAANELAEHDLLRESSPIRNARYKYRELAAKFLAIEHQFDVLGHVTDTKAATLYKLFQDTRGESPRITSDRMEWYFSQASGLLRSMRPVFQEDDRLLASIGTVVVYYLSFRNANFSRVVSRDALVRFESARREAGARDERKGPGQESDYLIEYNSLVQSTNDGAALMRRSEILVAFVENEGGPAWYEQLVEVEEDFFPEMDDIESDSI